MMTNIYKTITVCLLLSITGYSQELKQKIYSSDPSLASMFGSSEHNSTSMDQTTLIVADQIAREKIGATCIGSRGMISVFKRVAGDQWAISQILNAENIEDINFGIASALHKNTLAIVSGGTLYPRSAVYIYTRPDVNSNFQLKKKILGDIPARGSSYFHNVALNDDYLVIGQGDGGLFFYKILPDSFRLHKTYYSEKQHSQELKLTENNSLIAYYYYAGVEHLKISDDTIISTFSAQNIDRNYYENIAVNGNTVVHQTFDFTKNIVNYAFMKIDEDGKLMKSSDTIHMPQIVPYDIALKEDSLFFIACSPFADGYNKPASINILRFNGSNFTHTGKILPPANGTGYFGRGINYFNKTLLVSDISDSSQVYSGPKTCTGKSGIGSVSLISLKDIIVTSSKESISNIYPINSIINPNPLTGDILHINLREAESIEIINMQGIRVRKEQVRGNQCDLKGLQSGIYMVKVSSSSNIHSGRLVVE